MFGGEVRTLRVGYLNEIELTNIELDTKVHAFDHTILPVCDFSVVSESNTTGNSYAEDFCGGFTSIIIRPANFGHFCTNATELLLNN